MKEMLGSARSWFAPPDSQSSASPRADPTIVLRLISMSSVLLFSGQLSAAAGEPARVGQVKDMRGLVMIQHGTEWRKATIGDKVSAGDTIKTDQAGSFGITFVDKTMMTAGPSSFLTIDKYEFDAGTRVGMMSASLTSGAIILVTGEIAQANRHAIKIVAPIGVVEPTSGRWLITARVGGNGAP